MMEKYSQSTTLLIAYADFLDVVCNDYKAANEIRELALAQVFVQTCHQPVHPPLSSIRHRLVDCTPDHRFVLRNTRTSSAPALIASKASQYSFFAHSQPW